MRRCLFIDDSSVILKIAASILNGPDMMVAGAESASRALDICSIEMPDIIVLDADLPDMTTADFLHALRAIPSPTAPLIILGMVGFDVGTFARAKRAGVSGYLQKPFTRSQLLNAFRKLEAPTAA